MPIAVLNHSFVNHKSSEMICWDCGFVLWRCDTEKEATDAIVAIAGKKLACGKRWHHSIAVE